MNIIKKLPFEISSILFAFSILGSNFTTSNKAISFLCNLIGFILFIMILIKIFYDIRGFYRLLENPFKFSTFATLPLSIMFLSVSLNNLNPYIAFALWGVGFFIYIGFISMFTYKYVRNFSIKNIGTGWLVMYLGFVVVSLTCPIYTSKIIPLSLWLGFLLCIILLPYVYKSIYNSRFLLRRYDVSILCFPVSLLLLGFSYVYQDRLYIVNNLFILISQILYLYVLFRLLQIFLMKKEFNFDLSSIIFPLLITGVSLRVQVGVWYFLGQNISPFDKIYKVEIFLAVITLIYTIIKYFININKTNRS